MLTSEHLFYRALLLSFQAAFYHRNIKKKGQTNIMGTMHSPPLLQESIRNLPENIRKYKDSTHFYKDCSHFYKDSTYRLHAGTLVFWGT